MLFRSAAAAAAAKSLQLCLTLCDPIDGSQPGSSIPGILQAGILEWVASLEKTLMLGEIEDRRRRGQYNILLVSAIYQHESALGLCMSPSS